MITRGDDPGVKSSLVKGIEDTTYLGLHEGHRCNICFPQAGILVLLYQFEGSSAVWSHPLVRLIVKIHATTDLAVLVERHGRIVS